MGLNYFGMLRIYNDRLQIMLIIIKNIFIYIIEAIFPVVCKVVIPLASKYFAGFLK